jgi:flagellar assembly factor FliW
MTAQISVHSNKFGELSAAEEDILEFPEGLMGFHGLHRFALVTPSKQSPFRLAVSIEDPDVGFAVADPANLFSNYEVDLSHECEVLDIESDEDLAVYVMLSVPEDAMRTTANLLAPLVVNRRTRVGRQLVLSDSRYSTRHPIIAARQPT